MEEVLTLERWLSGLRDDVGRFMGKLQVPGQTGHFRPCLTGATVAGERAALGFSCFGLKIYYTLGLWDALPDSQRRDWLDFIRSYQILSEENEQHSYFVDPHLLNNIAPLPELGIRLNFQRWLRGEKKQDRGANALKGETKQAIATLAQVGASPSIPFYKFPNGKGPLRRYLKTLPWSEPWTAGALTAIVAVFLRSQGPLLDNVDDNALMAQTVKFIDGIADPKTGGYFRGELPTRDQLINGAMKVLNALDWLQSPVHYPEQLIDTCLEQGPPPAGCHVVDWIYVVHRCLLQTKHRKTEVQQQCINIAEMIKTHQNSDMGFAFQPGKAQHLYYGATISRGLNEGDIQGSCLLLWALSMIADILDMDQLGWKIIRP